MKSYVSIKLQLFQGQDFRCMGKQELSDIQVTAGLSFPRATDHHYLMLPPSTTGVDLKILLFLGAPLATFGHSLFPAYSSVSCTNVRVLNQVSSQLSIRIRFLCELRRGPRLFCFESFLPT